MANDTSLAGKRILITRPIHQAAQLVAELKSCGAEPVELPLIRVCPPDSWSSFDGGFSNLEHYAWLLFASVNAVETSIERVKYLNKFAGLTGKKIACIGPATAASLTQHGLSTSLSPSTYVAEGLLAEFPSPQPGNNRILWPRTNIGRLTIKYGLETKGWQVVVVHSYKTEGPQDPKAVAEQLKQLLQFRQLYAITLTSSETVKKLKEILDIATSSDSSELATLMASVKLAAIGPETANTCLHVFGRVDIQASEFTTSGLVKALLVTAVEI